MDHQKLKTMFLDYVKNYCTKILNLSASQCNKRNNGCGLNYDCPIGKRCEEDPTNDKGFVCKPGKVIRHLFPIDIYSYDFYSMNIYS